MTAPTINGTPTNTAISTAASPWTITMPTGIVAGERLLVFIRTGATQAPTLPSGWSWVLQNDGQDASDDRCSIITRIAAGSDTLSVSFAAAVKGVAHAYRIGGHHSSLLPLISDNVFGTGVGPNPPPIGGIEQASHTGNAPISSTTSQKRVAQSFISISTGPVPEAQIYLDTPFGSPTDSLTVAIHDNSASAPGTTVLATGTIPNPTGNAWNKVTFDTPGSLIAGTTYWLVVGRTDAGSGSPYWTWGQAASNIYAGGDPARDNNGTWAALTIDTTFDLAFRIGPQADFLCFTWSSMDGETQTVSTWPTGYSYDQRQANSGTGGAVDTNVRSAVAAKQTSAVFSDDPDAFQFGASANSGGSAFTLAVFSQLPFEYINTAEGGSDETTVTTGNSGGTSGHAWDTVVIGGSATVVFDQIADGDGSYAHRISSGAAQNSLLRWIPSSVPNTLYFRAVIAIDAWPAANTVIMRSSESDLTQSISLRLSSAGVLDVLNALSASLVTLSTPMPIDTWIKFELKGVISTGAWEIKVYEDPNSTTPDETQSGSGANLGVSGFGNLSFGSVLGTGFIPTMYLDNLGASDYRYPVITDDFPVGGTANTVTHVAPNVAILAGTHTQRRDRRPVHVAPNFIIAAGTHTQRKDRRPVHVAPNLTINAGTHLAKKSKVVVHVAPNVALAAGTHLAKAARNRSHVAPNLTLSAGVHLAKAGRNRTHVAPNFSILAGTHTQRKDRRPVHVAPNFILNAGTHTQTHLSKVTHVGPNFSINAGTHTASKQLFGTDGKYRFLLALTQSGIATSNYTAIHVAPNLTLNAGTHTQQRARRPAHVAPVVAIAAGIHTARAARRVTHVAPNVAISAGVHLARAGRRVIHVAPNVAIAAGTHTQRYNRRPVHVAPNLTINAGVHTQTHLNKVAHVAPVVALAAGVHLATKVRRVTHVAPNLFLSAGAHLTSKGYRPIHVAPNFALAAGTHTQRLDRRVTHVAPNMILAAGVHVAKKVKVLRPDGDLLAGGWTTHTGATSPLWDQLDEVYYDDGDYIRSSAGPSSDLVRLSMTNGADPGVSTGHVLRYRYGKQDAAGQVDLIVRLKQGVSTIATWTHTDIPLSPVTVEQTLSGGETDSITDYTDIRLEFEASET